jgi:hypothetical protein
MTTATSPFTYPTQPSTPTSRWFSKFGQALATWLTPSTEPSIITLTDETGEIWYRAYNPQTRQQQWLTSHDEVMIWLENQAML